MFVVNPFIKGRASKAEVLAHAKRRHIRSVNGVKGGMQSGT